MKIFFPVFFAILAAVAVIFIVPSLVNSIETPSQRAVAKTMHVQADVQAIKTQLFRYETMNGFYPTTEQGLQALVTQPQSDPRPAHWFQLFKELPKDPWGRDYIYRSPGRNNPSGYDLFSAGPDRRADTRDDDWSHGYGK
jgi:general secretion pathway protein G